MHSADNPTQPAGEIAGAAPVLAHSGKTPKSSEYLIMQRRMAGTDPDQRLYSSTPDTQSHSLHLSSHSAFQQQNTLCMQDAQYLAQPLHSVHPPAPQHSQPDGTSWHLCSSQSTVPSYQEAVIQEPPQYGTRSVHDKPAYTCWSAGGNQGFAPQTLQQPQCDLTDCSQMAEHADILSDHQPVASHCCQAWSSASKAHAADVSAPQNSIHPHLQLHGAPTQTSAKESRLEGPLKALQSQSSASPLFTAATSALAAEADSAAEAAPGIICPAITTEPSTSQACCNGQRLAFVSKHSSPEPADIKSGLHVWRRKERAPQVSAPSGCVFRIARLHVACLVCQTILACV